MNQSALLNSRTILIDLIQLTLGTELILILGATIDSMQLSSLQLDFDVQDAICVALQLLMAHTQNQDIECCY